MKYFALFTCLVAYVSATYLQAGTTVPPNPCTCLHAYLDLYNQSENLSLKLEQMNNSTQSIIDEINNATVIVLEQSDKLCETDAIVISLIQVENNNTNTLNNQTVVLNEILDDLDEICKNTATIEWLVAEESCILDCIANIASAALDACRTVCQAVVGAKAY